MTEESKINEPDDRLHKAAKAGDLERIKALIAAEVPVNGFNRIGDTPLNEAARENQVEAFQLLLSHGADPKLASKDGRTPEWVAQKWGYTKIVELARRGSGEKTR